MRLLPIFSLCASSLALVACGGGGPMNSAEFLASDISVCGYAPNCPVESRPAPPPTRNYDDEDDSDRDPNNGGNTGNTAQIFTGDASLMIEATRLKSRKGSPGITKLTLDNKGTATQSDDTAKIEVDTRTGANAGWPIAKNLEYFLLGESPTVTASPDGLRTIATRNLGGDYDEYRIYNRSPTGIELIDEELQLWRFDNSYITQYRDVSGGGESAGHQVWSFGGNKTLAADMPAGGTATYNGRFGSTARTWSFTDWRGSCSGTCIDINNIWRVEGSATASLDFGTGAFAGALTPETWIAMDGNGQWRQVSTLRTPGIPGTATYLAPGSTPHSDLTLIHDPVSNPRADYNYQPFMNDQIMLAGTLSRTSLPNAAVVGNTINGSTGLKQSDGWLTNTTTNTLFGGVFGPDPNEISGVFYVEGTMTDPAGGDVPIDGDRRAYIRHSGGFNVNCTEPSTTPTPSVCPP